jgi:hypothetical protein
MLIDWLELSQAIRQLDEQWAAVMNPKQDNIPLNQQISGYKHAHLKLDAVFELRTLSHRLDESLKPLGRSVSPAWHEQGEVEKLRNILEAQIAQRQLRKASLIIDNLEDSVRSSCLHPDAAPENHALRNAIKGRFIDEYTRSHSELKGLWNLRRSVEERDRWYAELMNKLPCLAVDLRESYTDPEWDSRLAEVTDAWNWVCADAWLHQITDPEAEKLLDRRIKQCRKESSLALSSLAAELAWKHCMNSMTEGHFQGLMAWRKAMEKLGKGTGKYVERNRSIARERLEECRGAIPAWIMPLYKVLDTVAIGKGIFDVAIIDEASQSGADALFLTFLAKKIVIVGDDQQIRPANVGIDYNDVHQLQSRFLRDIPKWDIFDPTGSLFSIAEVRFGNPIRLREHFRCMPEIIAFSNRLCYQDQPLIPLRQFGNDRLKPVLCTH